ncbi:Retrovirus-related Pol polyprotein from transposon 412 [Frankliniella fusca]|uniref:RNA-directed DNA polymerase n=2 Tax=Frankliniella fusca TaxID=407009 RepID=A0AAE1HBM4_9NEOP|nr:Retrovirus-related Pol polyprotein from transposon 412 [Frankliniella fusca]
MYGSFNGAQALREIINRYVWKNWEELKFFLPGENRQNYCKSHGASGTFATALQVQAAASLLNLEIFVKIQGKFQSFGKSSSRRKIFLDFTGDLESGHFEPLFSRAPVEIRARKAPVKIGGTEKQPSADAPGTTWFTVGPRGRLRRAAPGTGEARPEGMREVSSPQETAAGGPSRRQGPSENEEPDEIEVVTFANTEEVIELNLEALDEDGGRLFMVEGRLDGLRLEMGLDSCSTRCLVDEKFCTDRASIKPCAVRIKGANSLNLQVVGSYRAEISFSKKVKISNRVIVVKNLPVPMLVGDDGLRKLHAQLNYDLGAAVFKMNEETIQVKRLNEVSKSERKNESQSSVLFEKEARRLGLATAEAVQYGPVVLYTAEAVSLNPSGFTMVPIKEEGVLEILPAIVSPKRVLGLDSVYSVECLLQLVPKLVIPVFNADGERRTLPKNTPVAKIHVEDQSLSPQDVVYMTLDEIREGMVSGHLEIDVVSDSGTSSEISCAAAAVKDCPLPPLPSLENSDISAEEKIKAQELLEKFQDVFGYKLEPGTFIPNVFAHLERKDNRTFFKRNFPWNFQQAQLAKGEIDSLLRSEVIEEKPAKCINPVFCILKRESTPENVRGRFLLDARTLNKSLVDQSYSSTTIDEALKYCADKKLAFILDIVSYFHTIRLTDESKDYVGFTAFGKTFRFARLPFGVKTAPAIAQATMNQILRDCNTINYMDDIAGAGSSFDEVLQLLEKVLLCFRKNRLLVRPDKTQLFRKEVKLLGLVVKLGDSASPDPERFKPLKSLENPRTPKQLKSVICTLSYHRRFIRDFAIKTKHLNDMACEKIPFDFKETDRNLIKSMYTHLLETATLALFREDRKTKVHVDAAKTGGIAGFLAQKSGKDYLIVGYFSQPLKPTEKRWSAYHLECLAFYSCVKYFRKELMLLEKFIVVTDAAALKYLMKMEGPKPPFDRFISFLSQFQFEFEFVRSEQNKIPDGFSRLPQPEDQSAVKLPDSLRINLNELETTNVVEKEKALQSTETISSFKGDYGFLSNFYEITIFLEGERYKSLEHAYQAAKTLDRKERLWVSKAKTAAEAKARGRQVTLRKNWDKLKIQIMQKLIEQKFLTGTIEAEKLLATGNAHLIEGKHVA